MVDSTKEIALKMFILKTPLIVSGLQGSARVKK
jgi:hypothetical protein